MFCIQCGQQLGEDSKFCFVCGAKTQGEESIPANNSPPVQVNNTVANAPNAGTMPDMPQSGYIPSGAAPTPVNALHPRRQVINGTPETANTNDGRQRKVISIILAIALIAVTTTLATLFIRGQSDASVPVQPRMQATPAPDTNVRAEGNLPHVERVSYGHLANYPGTAVGSAFEQYFTDYEWRHFLSGNINYVSFFGTMQRDNESVTAQVLFRFTAGDVAFNATGLFLDGIWQETSVLNQLLDSVFENAVDEGGMN